MSIMKTYFDQPTQVIFWETAQKDYVGGIAYRDEVICGCCGGVFEIADLLDNAEEDGVQAIYEYKLWVDLSSEIEGEAYPADFYKKEED